MTKVAITEQYLTDIANAIRTKTGVSGVTYYPAEMADAISTIASSGGITPSGTISISENGTYNVTSYASASVNVTGGGGSPTINSLSVTPSESQQVFNSSSVDGYKPVTVGAISSTYVGSGVTQRSSTDLTELNGTVTVPAGYYASGASKAITSGSATGPSSISESSATLTTGTNTLTLTKTSVTTTPTVSAGYIFSATASTATVALTASVTVNPTPTASGATVTIPAGYYSSQTTKSVSSGSATGPSSLSASSATVSTGTNTVTFTKTGVTTTPTVSAGYVSSATASTATVSLTANINTRSSSDLTASNLTVTAPSGYYASNATKTLSDANLVAGNIKKNVTIFGTTGTYEGSGGGSGSVLHTGIQYASPSTPKYLSFSALSGEPTSFTVMSHSDISTSSPATISTVVYDGTNLYAQGISTTSNANVSYITSGLSQSYSDGTLVIGITNENFDSNATYYLLYTYGGTAANIGTADIQVGSGATSITFTNLEDEPECFSCTFKSTFSTSSGYQRVISVVYDGTDICGLEMDSSAKYSSTHWSYSYNNGSLTITSQGTNAGGYFHQPGYYQLTYAMGGDSTLQKKTVTPTGSDQTIIADTAQGYTALSQVKVEGITCTNLSAANIKSGVTVKIGTSTDDDSVTSVTGTYSAGGGSSVQYDTKTVTASNYPVSLSFSSMKGEPKFFVLRLNAQVSSSGNTTYYYIVDVVSDMTTTHGNCFRIGSTRRVDNITSGYSWSYSNSTLTVTSSAASRSASPGAFYSGSYELMYAY